MVSDNVKILYTVNVSTATVYFLVILLDVPRSKMFKAYMYLHIEEALKVLCGAFDHK